MSGDTNVKFTVRRVTTAKKMCTNCGGTGKIDRKTPYGFKQEPCTWCINGVAKIEHVTDVDLIDALTELGIKFVLPKE